MIVDDKALYAAAVIQMLIRNQNYQQSNVSQAAPALAGAAWDVAEAMAEEGRRRRQQRYSKDAD